jgi:hypothetical protein
VRLCYGWTCALMLLIPCCTARPGSSHAYQQHTSLPHVVHSKLMPSSCSVPMSAFVVCCTSPQLRNSTQRTHSPVRCHHFLLSCPTPQIDLEAAMPGSLRLEDECRALLVSGAAAGGCNGLQGASGVLLGV